MGKHSKILDSWKHEVVVRGVRVPVYGVKKSSKYGVFYGTVFHALKTTIILMIGMDINLRNVSVILILSMKKQRN